MRILVTGSRSWWDRPFVYRTLNDVCDEFLLNYPCDQYGNTMPDPARVTFIHGACKQGVDVIVDDWCIGSFLEPDRYPILKEQWERDKKRAGFLRNDAMVKAGADLCLAFIKDNSPGASMCANLAEKAFIPTRRFVS